jgi:hypothetical protein
MHEEGSSIIGGPANDNRRFLPSPVRSAEFMELAWQALAKEILTRGLGDGTDLVQRSDGEIWKLVDSRESQGRHTYGFLHRCHPTIGNHVYLQVTV